MATDAAEKEWGEMSESEQDALVQEVQSQRHPEEGDAAAGAQTAKTAANAETVDPNKDTKKPSDGADETPGAADAGQHDAADGEAEVEDGQKGQEGQGAESGDEPDWHDDAETWDFAKRMGVTEEEYSGILSREELDRTLRIIDRKAYDAETAKRSGAAAKAGSKPTSDDAEPPDVMAEVEQVFGDTFDEETKNALAKAIGVLHSRHVEETKVLREQIGAFQQAEDARQEAETERAINASIDAMGKPERYGKPGAKLTREQAANRAKVREAHLVHAQGLLARGGEPRPDVDFLRAADALAFVDDNQREAQREFDKRLKNQSRRITGGSSTRKLSKPVPDDPQARKRAIVDDPEIEAAYQKALAGG